MKNVKLIGLAAALAFVLGFTGLAVAANPENHQGVPQGQEGMAYREKQDTQHTQPGLPQGQEGMAYRENQGPQNDVYGRRNADGTMAQGSEGMAIREHPLYGNFPFDTLSRLTGKTANELYAEAYKDKVTAAALASRLGVFRPYKAQRLTAYKAMYKTLIKRGSLTQAQADSQYALAKNRISHLQAEQIDLVK